MCAQYKDAAGNESTTYTATIVLDTVKPTMTASATSPPGGAAYTAGAWATQDVQVNFTCADNAGGSGLATTTVARTNDLGRGRDGVRHEQRDVHGQRRQQRGLGVVRTDQARQDAADADRVCRQPAGGRGVYGWDLDEPERQGRLRLPGRRQRRRDRHGSGRHGDHRRRRPVRHGSGACTDNAGNSALSATFSISVLDETAPTASTTLDRGPDHNGWYNAAVAYTTTGTDATSGIASCTSGTYSGPDGTPGAERAWALRRQRRQPVEQLRPRRPSSTTTRLRAPRLRSTAALITTAGLQRRGRVPTTGTDATSGIASCTSGNYSGPDGNRTDGLGHLHRQRRQPVGDCGLGGLQVRQHRSRRRDDTRPGPDHNGWYNDPGRIHDGRHGRDLGHRRLELQLGHLLRRHDGSNRWARQRQLLGQGG